VTAAGLEIFNLGPCIALLLNRSEWQDHFFIIIETKIHRDNSV